MKKSELRKLIREVISESTVNPYKGQVPPELTKPNIKGMWKLACPAGYEWGPGRGVKPIGRPGSGNYEDKLFFGSQYCVQNDGPCQGIFVEGEMGNEVAYTRECLPEGWQDRISKPNPDPVKDVNPSTPSPNFDIEDSLGDAPVGGGGCGTANLGGLPSS